MKQHDAARRTKKRGGAALRNLTKEAAVTAAPRLLTPREAGRHLGVHEDTVRRWVNGGHMRAVDIGTPKYPRLRVREDDLAHFIEARTRGVPA